MDDDCRRQANPYQPLRLAMQGGYAGSGTALFNNPPGPISPEARPRAEAAEDQDKTLSKEENAPNGECSVTPCTGVAYDEGPLHVESVAGLHTLAVRHVFKDVGDLTRGP